MRKFVLLASTFVTLAAAAALPAAAALTAATSATFTLTGGALSISAPTGPVSLGTQPVSTSSSTISSPLGLVTVTDNRGDGPTWTASVIATAFTPPAGPADPASNVSYSAGGVTLSGAVVATATAASDLTGPKPIMSGSSAPANGVGSAEWNPTISVFIPANLAPGVYSATITHSVV